MISVEEARARIVSAFSPLPTEVVSLDQALVQLSGKNKALAELVELRLFMGMSSAEIAELQDVTTRTVERNWAKARALLSAWLDVA